MRVVCVCLCVGDRSVSGDVVVGPIVIVIIIIMGRCMMRMYVFIVIIIKK